jgi:tetratricopeptide (TPR) repeat protein
MVDADTPRDLQIKPGDPAAQRDRAIALLDLGRHADALPLLHQALARQPDDSRAMGLLSIAYAGLGCAQEALQWTEQAIRADPLYAFAHYNRGRLLVKTSRLDEARQALEEAVRLAPNNLEYLEVLTVLQVRAGELRNAEGTSRRMLALGPDAAISHIAAARVKLRQRRWRDAEVCAQQAVSLAPNSAMALALLGTAVMSQRWREREGLDLIHRAVKLDPNDPVANAALQDALQRYAVPRRTWWLALLALANPVNFVLAGSVLLVTLLHHGWRRAALPNELKLYAKHTRAKGAAGHWRRNGLRIFAVIGLMFGISGFVTALHPPFAAAPLISRLAVFGGITALAIWGLIRLRGA